MEKLGLQIIAGVVSVWSFFLYWYFNLAAPSGWAPYGGFCFVLMGAITLMGTLAGAVVGKIGYAIMSRYELSDQRREIYGAILTIIVVGIVALVLLLSEGSGTILLWIIIVGIVAWLQLQDHI
ncbi:MAG: hypothetical protein R3D55_27525 [Chloroflexota bacterium]